MKFTKLIHFDVRNGICKNVGLILAPVIIALISFVDFNRKFYPLALAESSTSNVIPTYADHIMYIYGGMAQYIPNPAEPFQFPARWMIWFMSLLFFMSSYAYNDMQTFGIQILTRSGSRRAWWLSKTLWCFFEHSFSCSPLVGGMHCLHGDEGGTFSCFTCRHNLQAFSDLFHRYGNRRNTNLPACFAVACCCFIFLVSMPDDPFFVYQTNT